MKNTKTEIYLDGKLVATITTKKIFFELGFILFCLMGLSLGWLLYSFVF